MNAVERADNRELAEISIVLPPFSSTREQQEQSSASKHTTLAATATSTSITPPHSVQRTSITGNLISIPMHLAASRMVCFRTTPQDCMSVTQAIYPITSTPEATTEGGPNTGHPIFISTSPNPTITTAPPSTAYSTSSNGSTFLASDGDKVSIDGRRKRPASSIASSRNNKNRFHIISESVTRNEAGVSTLSPREQRAQRRKEKSRLAAKERRNQESNILSCLLQSLPVSLSDPSANSDGSSAGSKSPMGLNLEKSGVIRMAGQTLFLYNSLSRFLGSKAMPFVSLLSKSLFGLLIQPSDSTVVYATPPLAEAISWPWINLIGVKLDSLTDDGKMPLKPGDTVRLRMLEQTGSSSKNTAHFSAHNRPTTPQRSPSHSPTSTVSNSTNSGGDQTSSLWSPHLYRSSKNGVSSVLPGNQCSSHAGCGKTAPYLLCSCFAILRVLIKKPEEMKTTSSTDTTSITTSSNAHLKLYLLQPTPNIGVLKDSHETISSSSLLSSVSFGKTPSSSIPVSPSSTVSSASTSSFHRSKERYFLNRQRRLLMQNPSITAVPSKPVSDEEFASRHIFCTILDRNLSVKWIETSDSVKASTFSSMTGQSFLDFISLDDLRRVSNLLADCAQRRSSLWTSSYRLRIPDVELNGNQQWSRVSKFIWVRSLLSPSSENGIRCIHHPIGDVQQSGVQFYLHQPKPTIPAKPSHSESRHLISPALSSLTLGSTNTNATTTTTQVKRPIRVLKLQSHRPPLPQQPVQPSPTLQPINMTSSIPSTTSGPFLAPARDAQIIYDTSTCLTPQTIVTTPWVIYTRSISAPQTELVKPVAQIQPIAQTVPSQPEVSTSSTLPPILTPPSAPPKFSISPQNFSQNSSFNFLLPDDCTDGPSLQRSSNSPSHSLVDSIQSDKRPSAASSPTLNLPDMLQELDPETLAMLENEDAKSDSLLTSLSFDDIISSISITPSSRGEVNPEKTACPSGSFCSSESSPPSLSESLISTCYNRSGKSQQIPSSCCPQQYQKQYLQQSNRDISLFSDVDIDADLPSDSDEFWDAFVTNVMNLPLDSTNLPMDVR